ncbi:MAG: C39 family peptidase [Anaerolineae bacterium]|nr:C39 family peptidase [Anaerolineae bacterium]
MAPKAPQPRAEGVSLSGAMARQGGQPTSRSMYRRILYDTEACGSQYQIEKRRKGKVREMLYVFTLKKIGCKKCLPPTQGSDRCEISISVDGRAPTTIVRDFSPGSWFNPGSSYHFQHHIQVSLKSVEPMLVGLGSFTVLGSTSETVTVLGKPNCEYEFDFSVEESREIRKQKKVSISTNIDRYVVTDLRYNTYSLFLNENDLPHPLQDPNQSGTPYHEVYVQNNPPYPNGCGPVAGRNLLHWYGKDASWDTLAGKMKTNDWDNMFIALAALLDPVILASVATIVAALTQSGTLPDHLESALNDPQIKPSGYRIEKSTGSISISELNGPLQQGSPVVVLYAHPNGILHWSVVTGTYWKNGEVWVRLANATDLPFHQFSVGWALNHLGSVVKGFLGNPPWNEKPGTMMYYQK